MEHHKREHAKAQGAAPTYAKRGKNTAASRERDRLFAQRRWLVFLGVKALIVNKGRVLLLSSGPLELSSTMRRRRFWDLPGGKMERGEGIADALAREVSEELGIRKGELMVSDLFDVSLSRFKTSHGMRIPLVLLTYRCGLRNPGRAFRLTGEHASYEWVSPGLAARRLAVKFGQGMANRLSASSLGGIR